MISLDNLGILDKSGWRREWDSVGRLFVSLLLFAVSRQLILVLAFTIRHRLPPFECLCGSLPILPARCHAK